MSEDQLIVNNLILIAKTYAEVTGRSLTAISKEFYGRGDFFAELEKGEQTISLGRFGKMMTDFREKWPKDQRGRWPQGAVIRMKLNGPHKS